MQRTWLDRLERDHDNIRAAFAWSLTRDDPSEAVRLVYALWRFWQQRGYLDEGRRNIDPLSERIDGLTPESRARFAEAAGGVAYWQADFAVAVSWYDAALAIRRELADPDDPQSQRELANALYNRGYTRVAQIMGVAAEDRHPDPTAQPMMEEALALYRTWVMRPGKPPCCGVSAAISCSRVRWMPRRSSSGDRSRSMGQRSAHDGSLVIAHAERDPRDADRVPRPPSQRDRRSGASARGAT